MFAPLNFSIGEAEARSMAEKALDDFGLSEYEKRDIEELSGGEKQRLMLASVFVMDPKLIILDEAFSFLDLRSKALLSSMIEKRKREGKGIISVTHDTGIAALSDRIILLKNGRVAADGKTEEILSDVPLLLSADVRVRDEDMFAYLTGGVDDKA